MQKSSMKSDIIERGSTSTIVYHEIIEQDDESKEGIYTIEPIGDAEYEEITEMHTNTGSESGQEDLLASNSKQSKSHFCPNCGNCYGAAGSLKLHIRACLRQKETEKNDLEARKCHICGKVYNSISYLKEHLLRHSGKGPRKCNKCSRKFLSDERYEAHIKEHENELPVADEIKATNVETGNTSEKKVIKQYTCSFCQKMFTVVFDSRHTKRRYACDECRDRFTNEEELRKHKESLEEKKEFRCEKCGRIFVFEGFLQRHMPACDGIIKKKKNVARDSN